MGKIDNSSGIERDTPVTIIVKRRPKPDRIEDFEKVMSGTTRDAMSFKGHLGANIIRPTKAGDYYRIIFKFDSMRNYLAWEGSELREQWLERYSEVEQGGAGTGNPQRTGNLVYHARRRSTGPTT